jgi:hypothetical protein
MVDRATTLMRTHGRSEAIDIVMQEYANSPMMRGLPKGLVRVLFETMLDAAGAGGPMAGKRGAARRRKGGRR